MTAPHVAVIDGASFALPYVHGLSTGLVRRGWRVTLFASRTAYNGAFLDDARRVPGLTVEDAAVSRTVAARTRGALAYAGLWWRVWRRRATFDAVDLQFSALWPVDLPFAALLRRHFVFTVHNAVPHGFAARRHRPTLWLAALARRLVFLSPAVRDDFLARYGASHAAKARLLPHGLTPLSPGRPIQVYDTFREPQALVFWSTVKPYKGIELFAELARSPAWREQGLPLEVHGRWDASLHALRDELVSLGVHVVDRFLDEPALAALFARDVLFVLPHQRATQSGAMYTLLHHARLFIAADSGDLGERLRRHGLAALLMPDRSPAGVLAALQALRADAPRVVSALAALQAGHRWDAVLAGAADAFGVSEGVVR